MAKCIQNEYNSTLQAYVSNYYSRTNIIAPRHILWYYYCMTKSEIRKLKTFVSKLRKDAARIEKGQAKRYEDAGHGEGTGDEGWSRYFLLEGNVIALKGCARDLDNLIEKLTRT